jgi:ABC-2 type transport system ATP-binding protein
MGQRLGLASALLGDPRVILLDEPVNGLDSDGVRWIRGLLRALAEQGKAVLVSSHLMTEMQLVADHVLVLGRGRVLADVPMADLARRGRTEVVLLTEPGDGVRRLVAVLPDSSPAVEVQDELATVRVKGEDEAVVGRAAHLAGVPVFHLSARPADLESGYLDLVADEADYMARGGTEHVD